MRNFQKTVEYKGIKFASTPEMERYIELERKQSIGEIKDLERQKLFELLPKIIRYEKKVLKTKTKIVERTDERAVKYHCDFYYYDIARGVYVIEEVKSKFTAKIRDYPLRRRLIKFMIERLNKDAGYTKYTFNEIVVK